MTDIFFMVGVSLVCVVISYVLYMKKELSQEHVGLRSNNGSGEGFYGKKNIRLDGSYVSTKWFMILLVPIIPLGTYRVWKGDASHDLVIGPGIGFQTSTPIKMERLTLDWSQVFFTYGTLFLITLLIFIFFKSIT